MDKTAKLDYQRKLEQYLEDKNIYNMFEDLMQLLVIHKPEDPLNFLIERLSRPETKKIFLVGPAGSSSKEIVLELCDYFGYTPVSIGDLLKKEISKKSNLGQEIEHSLKTFTYVKDEVVIEIVKKEINQLEKEKKNYIIEGFPKTRVQGLAMQSAGIIPNAFIILNLSSERMFEGCLEKLKNNQYLQNALEGEKSLMAHNHLMEYSLNVKELTDIYTHYYYQVDAENNREEILEDVARLIKYRIKSNAPKRATKILVLGAPGSGRTLIGQNMAKKYGLVFVSTYELIKDIIRKKSKLSPIVLELVNKGELIPDEIMIPILNSRIQQTDCQMQGFVLDGFPKTLNQLKALDDLKIRPNLILTLETTNELMFDRVSYLKVDPLTGVTYNTNNFPDKMDPEVIKRLQNLPLNNMETLQARFGRWKEFVKHIENQFSKNLFKANSVLDPKNILEKVSFHLENN